MKGSLIIVGCFLLGAFLGWLKVLPAWIVQSDLSSYVLYALMLQVGIGIGSDPKLRQILRSIRPHLLLVPLATITGTLLFSALISFVIERWSLTECLAVSSGFAYYSLSSILIMELKTPDLGAQLATELATIALLTNVIRELVALVGAPFICKYFGKLAPISVAGVTSVDVALPSIIRVSGKEMVPLAIFHGLLVDMSVPFFISLFCKL